MLSLPRLAAKGCWGLLITPCPAGASAKPARLAAAELSLPSRPRAAQGWGPEKGLLGPRQVTFSRKVLGLGPLFLGPYSSRSLSLRPRNTRGYGEPLSDPGPGPRAALPAPGSRPRPANWPDSLLLEGGDEPRVQDVLLGLPSTVPAGPRVHKPT